MRCDFHEQIEKNRKRQERIMIASEKFAKYTLMISVCAVLIAVIKLIAG